MIVAEAAIPESEMIAELRIVFPTLWFRPLSDFGAAYRQTEGVWTGEDSAHCMPDGQLIFNDLAAGTDEGDTVVHPAFEAWLARRGWVADRYDGTTWFLLPDEPWPDELPEGGI